MHEHCDSVNACNKSFEFLCVGPWESRVPCPVGLEEGGVVDNGWEQGREAPQQQGGEELGDDGILEDHTDKGK